LGASRGRASRGLLCDSSAVLFLFICQLGIIIIIVIIIINCDISFLADRTATQYDRLLA